MQTNDPIVILLVGYLADLKGSRQRGRVRVRSTLWIFGYAKGSTLSPAPLLLNDSMEVLVLLQVGKEPFPDTGVFSYLSSGSITVMEAIDGSILALDKEQVSLNNNAWYSRYGTID